MPGATPAPEHITAAQSDSASPDKLARAAKRRATWLSGAYSTSAEKAVFERAFWDGATPTERLDAVVQMAIESELIQGHEPPDRLQRSVGGVRR